VLVEGKKIVAVGPNCKRAARRRSMRAGKIVMPGFIDTHHQPVRGPALRSFVADGLLFNDGQPHGAINYFQYILGTFAGVYRPRGRVHQRAVRVAFPARRGCPPRARYLADSTLRSSTPKPRSRAAQLGRRIVFGFFEGARADLLGSPPARWYPEERQHPQGQVLFLQADQLSDDVQWAGIYLLGNNTDTVPGPTTEPGRLGDQLGIPIAAHIVAGFGMGPEFDKIAQSHAR